MKDAERISFNENENWGGLENASLHTAAVGARIADSRRREFGVFADRITVRRAKGAVAEVRSYVEETMLTSPISGKISEIFPQRGELVGSGAPIMNVIDTADVWVTFNLREKDMAQFSEGTEFKAFIPALDNKEISLKVNYVKDMGSFAAWKATKVAGEFDSKTFEIRAVPVEKVDGLVSGMSVIVKR